MNKEMKNLILYGLGRAVSSFGSIIYSFAIGLYVLNTTGSGMKFAVTLLVAFLPSLILTPFAGVLADKFDKKKIVVRMDLLNGLLFVLFYFYITVFDITLAGVYITSFLTNVITSFFGIAFEASKPQLVFKAKYQAINSMSQIIYSISNILGPVLGGFIYAFVDIKLFIFFNGVSFILSGFSEMFINFELNKEKVNKVSEQKMNKVFTELKEGFRYITKQHSIMAMYGFFLGINILMSIAVQVPLPYILNTHLNIGSDAYGIVFALLPIGMIVGALIVGKVVNSTGIPKLYMAIGTVSGFVAVLLGLPYFIPLLISSKLITIIYYGAILMVFGLIISLVDVPFATHIQSTVDSKYIGRVWGILIPMIKIANPIGFLLSGFLIEIINPFLIPFISGIIFILFTVISGRKMININFEEERLEA